MRKVLAAILLLASVSAPAEVLAAACVSAGSGGWSVAGTWAACGGTYPQAGDTVTVQVGHQVDIDGNTAFGTAGAPACELTIAGTLQWPSAPGASWTMTASGNICLTGTGTFSIATSGVPLSCTKTATISFTNAAQIYNLQVQSATSGGFRAYGCPSYPDSAGSVVRARISSCTPSCTVGAGRTITFDRDVNWVSSASLSNPYIMIGQGGNETTAPAAGDRGEAIISWSALAANKIDGVTLAYDHKAGDIVYNATRNILIRSASATIHTHLIATVNNTTAGGAFDLQWVQGSALGDSTGPVAAIDTGTSFSVAGNAGTFKYVALINSHDGGAANFDCFRLESQDFVEFDSNLCSYVGNGGCGVQTGYLYEFKTVNDFTYIGNQVSGSGVCVALSSFATIDGAWLSCLYEGVVAGWFVIDSLIHRVAVDGIRVAGPATAAGYQRKTGMIAVNEIRHSSGGAGINVEQSNVRYGLTIQSNNIDDIFHCCFDQSAAVVGVATTSASNSFDGCNSADDANYGAVCLEGAAQQFWSYADSVGSAVKAYRTNILVRVPTAGAGHGSRSRIVWTVPLLAAPLNPHAWTSDIYFPSGVTGYSQVTYLGQDTAIAIHDKNGVAGSMDTWGPFGAYITHDVIAGGDDSLGLKVVPGGAYEYARIPIGTAFVTDGQTVTVVVDVQASAVVQAGQRPRVSLEGCGLIPYDVYAEHSGAAGAWETLTVSDTVDATGMVHVWLEVRNNLNAWGVDPVTPVWPPTLEIHADNYELTKTGP